MDDWRFAVIEANFFSGSDLLVKLKSGTALGPSRFYGKVKQQIIYLS